MFTYNLSILLTSTAFVSTNAKYGIPLSRYTVFLQNCPLGYDPKSVRFLELYFKAENCIVKNAQKDGLFFSPLSLKLKKYQKTIKIFKKGIDK